MKRRFVTALYWFVLGINALFWLSDLGSRWQPRCGSLSCTSLDFPDTVALILAMLAPFGVLPVIRWLVTGRWYIDPRG